MWTRVDPVDARRLDDGHHDAHTLLRYMITASDRELQEFSLRAVEYSELFLNFSKISKDKINFVDRMTKEIFPKRTKQMKAVYF